MHCTCTAGSGGETESCIKYAFHTTVFSICGDILYYLEILNAFGSVNRVTCRFPMCTTFYSFCVRSICHYRVGLLRAFDNKPGINKVYTSTHTNRATHRDTRASTHTHTSIIAYITHHHSRTYIDDLFVWNTLNFKKG